MEVVNRLYLSSRSQLARFLQDYRNQTNGSETVASFLLTAKPQYSSESDLLEKNIEHWRGLLQLRRAADAHKYPVATVQDITAKMNRGERDSIIVYLLPTEVGMVGLLSAYREVGDEIRRWRELRNTEGGGTTIYLSVYADPLRTPALLRLENAEGSISHALSTAIRTSNPTCLMYGYRNDLNRRSWMALNHEHWGMVVDPLAKTRYLGFLKDGQPHGMGTMTYVNSFSYTGDWLLGKRDGNGVLYRDDRLLLEGPFIDNRPAEFGHSLQMIPEEERITPLNTVPVEVTIHRGTDSIGSAIFAVLTGPPPHRQAEKIARAFGWKPGERYALTPTLEVNNVPGVPGGRVKSRYTMVVNGTSIESGPYAGEQEWWNWPDDKVVWNGEEDTIRAFNRKFYPFPPLVGPDPTNPSKPTLQSGRSRPVKIEAQHLS